MQILVDKDNKKKFLLEVFFEKKHELLDFIKKLALEENDQNTAILATQVYLYLSQHPRNIELENQIRNLLKPPANVALLSDEMLNYLATSAPSSLTIIALESITYKSYIISQSNIKSFIIETLNNPNPAIRIASCKAITETKDPELFIHLLLHLTDPDINVAKFVYKIFVETPRSELNSLLEKALNLENKDLELSLAKFIRILASKDLEPFLHKAKNHHNPEISKSALNSLEKIKVSNSYKLILHEKLISKTSINNKTTTIPNATPITSQNNDSTFSDFSNISQFDNLSNNINQNIAYSTSQSQQFMKVDTVKPKTEKIISVREKLAKKYQSSQKIEPDQQSLTSTNQTSLVNKTNQYQFDNPQYANNTSSDNNVQRTTQTTQPISETPQISQLPQKTLASSKQLPQINISNFLETSQNSQIITSISNNINKNNVNPQSKVINQISPNLANNTSLKLNSKTEAIILKFPSFVSKPLEKIYETFPKPAFIEYYLELLHGFIAYLIFTFLQTYLFYCKRNAKLDELVIKCLKENLIFTDAIRAIKQFSISISDISGNDNFFTFALARQILESESHHILDILQNLWTTANEIQGKTIKDDSISNELKTNIEYLIDLLAFCRTIITNKIIYKTPPGAREPYFDLTGPTLTTLKISDRPTFDAPSGELIVLSKDRTEALGLFPYFMFDGEKILYKKPSEQNLKILYQRLDIL